MPIKLSEEPATLADMIQLMTVLTIEIMRHAALHPPNALDDIAGRLLTASQAIEDPRNRALIHGFAVQLTATESE